jgi:hypothetical protein
MFLNICSRYERMRCSRIKWHNYRSVIDEKHTNDNVWSFLGFLHNNMVDSPMSIVLLGSYRNRVGSMGQCRCKHSSPRRASAWIGAFIRTVTSLSIGIAVQLGRRWILSSLHPLNIQIYNSRGLEIVGV